MRALVERLIEAEEAAAAGNRGFFMAGIAAGIEIMKPVKTRSPKGS